jgi:hypothetical protein
MGGVKRSPVHDSALSPVLFLDLRLGRGPRGAGAIRLCRFRTVPGVGR